MHYISRYELTRDLCLALVISTATTHMVTKVPRVPNPQNTLASSCQHRGGQSWIEEEYIAIGNNSAVLTRASNEPTRRLKFTITVKASITSP